ncbi:hypothetical protein C8J57DRAFT_1094932, partial [Mycena rebaudengoi]
FRFLGMTRACYIGEDEEHLSPCDHSECNLCSILRSGFDVERAGPDSMFGSGIYSSEISSKANGYVWNSHIHSKLHAMIMCDVVVGMSQKLYSESQGQTSPDFPYDSVEGVTVAKGGSLNHPETVVYQVKAIMACMLIMYTRK